MPRRCAPASLAVVLVLLATAGCARDRSVSGSGAGGPAIVATTSIWADVVANLACDDLAEVTTLIPSGADAHAFEPSLTDRATLDDAALVVANGLGLEHGLEGTLDQVEADGTPVFSVGSHIETLGPASVSASGDHPDHPGGGAGVGEPAAHDHDPHVWLDPTRVSAALDPLARALVDDAGLDAAAVEQCRSAYQAELAAADRQVREILDAVDDADRQLVTNHDTLAYLADRYGFEVLGTVIPSTSTLAESSPAALAELRGVVDDADVTTVFAEAALADADARSLADEVGVEVVVLHAESLGDEASGADTYVGYLLTNAELIADGLGKGG